MVDGPRLYISGIATRWDQTSLHISDGGAISRIDGGAFFGDGGNPWGDGILVQVGTATGAAAWAERQEYSHGNRIVSTAIAASGAIYALGTRSGQGPILLTRIPGAPDPTLVRQTDSPVIGFVSSIVRLGPMLAMTGYQSGPFSVDSLNMDPGPLDGGAAGFILLVAPP